MPRIPRMLIAGEPTVYHVMSRTALDGYVLGDVEKGHLLAIIKHLSRVYFVDVLGFCIMGNHFHLLIRMLPGDLFDNNQILSHYKVYYGPDEKAELTEERVEFFRRKWSSLSEYVREIKQKFSRFYNKRHGRKGFFWGDRFKSVIVEDGDTLINCLAYIDLNPVRAGLCKRPEDYRWGSLGYHIQAKNKDDFLSLDFGLLDHDSLDNDGRLARYINYVYEKAGIASSKKPPNRGVCVSRRFISRTRYFTDSAVIGTKDFISACYQRFRDYFTCRREKRPIPISGLYGIYSLKRLSE